MVFVPGTVPQSTVRVQPDSTALLPIEVPEREIAQGAQYTRHGAVVGNGCMHILGHFEPGDG
jgi:hypothetical protein